MTDFRNAMKAVSKGKSMVSRRGWNGSRYKPSWEDLFATDWFILPTDKTPIKED